MANAMKFTSPGGKVKVGVVLKCINNNCTLTYKVEDTGVRFSRLTRALSANLGALILALRSAVKLSSAWAAH